MLYHVCESQVVNIKVHVEIGSKQKKYTVSRRLFTARSSYASAVLGIAILSVCLSLSPSISLSVTRVLCDEMKKHTADILIPHERVINLVFFHQQRLVGDVHFHLKFALKLIHPPLKNDDFDQYLLITSQP